jgi:hypothetical protein
VSIEIKISGSRVNFSRWNFTILNSTWRNRVAPVVLEALRAEAPEYKYDDASLSRGQKRGDLKNSISIESVGGGLGSAEMVFISDAPYAKYVISGTGGHGIPTGGLAAGKILHWERSGTHTYRRWVYHPGTAPNNFPDRAVTAVQPLVGTTLSAIVRDLITPEQT